MHNVIYPLQVHMYGVLNNSGTVLILCAVRPGFPARNLFELAPLPCMLKVPEKAPKGSPLLEAVGNGWVESGVERFFILIEQAHGGWGPMATLDCPRKTR